MFPLLAAEPSSRAALALVASDPDVVVWWGTQTECVSAAVRREREGTLDDLDATLVRLDTFASEWVEVDPSMPVRQLARRLLRVHTLRAADAFQLAAAITAAESHATSLPFVTLDRRLAEAARREGFPVVEPS